MDQNFSLMAQSRANYYTAGSPVQFVRVELLKGDTTGEVAVCLTFKNVGTEPLTGLVVHFKCKDAAGQVLCEDDFYYEQLNAQPGAVFGSDDAVYVSDTPVSSVEVEQDRAFLNGLLEHMDSAAEVKVYESEKGRYKVFLEGEKLGALIGRRGETLDAIQQLTNYSINRGSEKNRARVQVDAENYREKREQSLERLAEKVAGKVTKYRRNVTLEPMNAYERHVIHTALQDTPSVTTFSIGTEPNRRVVVSYDRTKA
jgi:predicted RNA-binding protein Jag